MALGNNELTIPHPVSTGRLAVVQPAVLPVDTDVLCVPVETSTGRISVVGVVPARSDDKLAFPAMVSTGKVALVRQCVNEIHETFTGNQYPLSDPWEHVGDVFKAGGFAQINVDGSNEEGFPTYIFPVCHADQKGTLAITPFAGRAQMRVILRILTVPLFPIHGVSEFWQCRWAITTAKTLGAVSIIKVVGGVVSIEADSGFNVAYITPDFIEGLGVANVITATTNDVSVNTTDGDGADGKYVGFSHQVLGGVAVGAIESTSFDYVKGV